MDFDFFCSDCPRRCSARRSESLSGGFCRSRSLPSVVRAAPHFGEEPCITGSRGSGAVFFSGCSLGCIFCQNYEISRSGENGELLDESAFRDMLLRLRDTGVHNINLVTPGHFTRFLSRALDGLELGIPVVWNSSGYETAESLKMMEGLVQIYMPDYKFSSSELARRLCRAPDYPDAAAEAIREMFRQRGPYTLDADGMMTSGVLIRHLVLPGESENTLSCLDFIADSFPENSVLVSLMSQYTPMSLPGLPDNLQRGLTPEEYDSAVHYMSLIGLSSGFTQDLSSGTPEMLPLFDLTGVT